MQILLNVAELKMIYGNYVYVGLTLKYKMNMIWIYNEQEHKSIIPVLVSQFSNMFWRSTIVWL